MYTEDKGEFYTAQITPYGSIVSAEILQRYSFSSGGYASFHNVMSKQFKCKKWFQPAPKEQQYIDATTWVKEQLNILEKHGTAVISLPLGIYNERRLAEIRKEIQDRN